ncbi:MAG: response regulator [Syntrophobacterales bacterium]|nr:MAG: response regulator [Syntrophobacterales bacterium]
MDYNLPGINGLEVCLIQRGEENTRNIPIVFMSAKDKGEIRKVVADVGADGYISLPFEGEELNKKIKELIKSRK